MRLRALLMPFIMLAMVLGFFSIFAFKPGARELTYGNFSITVPKSWKVISGVAPQSSCLPSLDQSTVVLASTNASSKSVTCSNEKSNDKLKLEMRPYLGEKLSDKQIDVGDFRGVVLATDDDQPVDSSKTLQVLLPAQGVVLDFEGKDSDRRSAILDTVHTR